MLPTFVAEFTTNHMGNLNLLLRMVAGAVDAGCDYVKMQKKDVETFYAKEKLDARYISPYGKTYREYRTTFEFSEEDFTRFDNRCRELGVRWFSTVHDIASLHFMLRYDIPMFKVASCSARNIGFLKAVADEVPHHKPIVLSVGGSTLPEIEQALKVISNHHVYLLHCVAEYPCPPESLRLGNIRKMIRLFGGERVTIGYSGHEEGIAPTLAAVDLGACMVERHFCLSRHSFVHHIECSLEPEEFKEMVRTIRSGVNLSSMFRDLPAAAFEVNFGMSEVEKSFLFEQTYGRKYLKRNSEF